MAGDDRCREAHLLAFSDSPRRRSFVLASFIALWCDGASSASRHDGSSAKARTLCGRPMCPGVRDTPLGRLLL